MTTLENQKELLEKYGDNYLAVTKTWEKDGRLMESTFVFAKGSNVTREIVDTTLKRFDKFTGENVLYIVWEEYTFEKDIEMLKEVIYKHYNI